MENKVYCIFCGRENKTTDKFCHKCGENLNRQDEQLKEYLSTKVKDTVKDNIKDKVTDTALDMLKKFLNSKAYGIILSLSVVANLGTVLTGGNSHIKKFDNPNPGVDRNGNVIVWDTYGRQGEFTLWGITVYADYDETGTALRYYIYTNPQQEAVASFKVTGANGKIIYDEKVVYDEQALYQDDKVYIVNELNCTIELREDSDYEEHIDYIKAEMQPNPGLKRIEEYSNGNVETIIEYHDNGERSYYYRPEQFRPYEINDIIAQDPETTGLHELYEGYSETHYDTDGELTESVKIAYNFNGTEKYEVSRTVVNKTADKRTENQYLYNGVLQYSKVQDNQGKLISEMYYNEDGSFSYGNEYEYFESGRNKITINYYKEGQPRYYTEYYENGDKKLEIYYTDYGATEHKSEYDAQGNGVTINYTHRYTEFDDRGNGIGEIQELKQTEYHSVKDENGMDIYVKEIHYSTYGKNIGAIESETITDHDAGTKVSIGYNTELGVDANGYGKKVSEVRYIRNPQTNVYEQTETIFYD